MGCCPICDTNMYGTTHCKTCKEAYNEDINDPELANIDIKLRPYCRKGMFKREDWDLLRLTERENSNCWVTEDERDKKMKELIDTLVFRYKAQLNGRQEESRGIMTEKERMRSRYWRRKDSP